MTPPPDAWARDCARSLGRSRARRAVAPPLSRWYYPRIAVALTLFVGAVLIGVLAPVGTLSLGAAFLLVVLTAAVAPR